jgi:hypothetical protein
VLSRLASFSGCAVATQAEDFEIVLDILETVICRDLGGPGLHSRSLDLDRTAAAPAHEVMMMTSGASAVSRLAVVGSDGVQQVGPDHQLEGSIDGGEADSSAGVAEVVVNLARCAELVCPTEHLFHCGTLAGFALRDGHRPLLCPPAITSSG